ncbi:uncharacterized protein METZ01_LOCUS127677 [marine metagenome]|uniref:Uncharacterized protein n=1 Tax=marine metagenome TaxID=408172 RepID=A0A381YE48_9ZZZZ
METQHFHRVQLHQVLGVFQQIQKLCFLLILALQ